MSFPITITAIKAFTDNYIWCIHDAERAVVVDPGDAVPVKAFLQTQGLALSDILITHHHYDHTGGVYGNETMDVDPSGFSKSCAF